MPDYSSCFTLDFLFYCLTQATQFNFLGSFTGRDALEFLKSEGGCTYTKKEAISKQEWYNQKRERINYFRTFPFHFDTMYCWKALTTDPYANIYDLRLVHIQEAGLMEMLSRQQLPMKPMEPDVLKPLKLEHFYITIIGIGAGNLMALLAFLAEKLAQWVKSLE